MPAYAFAQTLRGISSLTHQASSAVGGTKRASLTTSSLGTSPYGRSRLRRPSYDHHAPGRQSRRIMLAEPDGFSHLVAASPSSYRWLAKVPAPVPTQFVRLACREYFQRHARVNANLADAELIVAELVANVVRHGGGSAAFYLDWRGLHPRLLVLDHGPGFPNDAHSSLDDPYAESGRGIALVRCLGTSMTYGNRPHGGAFVRVFLPVERKVAREGLSTGDESRYSRVGPAPSDGSDLLNVRRGDDLRALKLAA